MQTDTPSRACPACAGNGFAPRHAARRSPCKACGGSGRRKTERKTDTEYFYDRFVTGNLSEHRGINWTRDEDTP